jgi:hypothetical protein
VLGECFDLWLGDNRDIVNGKTSTSTYILTMDMVTKIRNADFM